LITELTAGDAAAWVVSGRPGDSGAPYATLARLIARLLAPRLSLASSLSSNAQRTLSRIALTASEDPAASPLPPGAMAAAVAELLQQAGARTVVLDDLHFADAATTELVAGLASAPDTPQRWLFAQRPAEASTAAQNLRDALGELQRLSVVKLKPLDVSAAAVLVESLAIPGLQGATLAEALVRHTGGNPLFVLETLKQGLTDGSLARGELPRPASVGALIERRLQRLSEPALTLARVAAVAGVDFGIELAEAAIGVRAVQLASAWGELQTAHVLRDETFAHDLVADAVLRGVPVVVARRVHAQCAAWLQERGGEPSRLAWHWHHGGQPRLSKRVRRVEEPMGLERLHNPGHQPLPDHSQSVRAGLQRVEWVLQGGQPEGAHGGHHAQTAVAGGGGPRHAQRRTNVAVSHPVAWQGHLDQIADRQYPCGFTARQGCCGANQDNGPAGRAVALRQRQDRASHRAIQAAPCASGYGVTARFRINELRGLVSNSGDPLRPPMKKKPLRPKPQGLFICSARRRGSVLFAATRHQQHTRQAQAHQGVGAGLRNDADSDRARAGDG